MIWIPGYGALPVVQRRITVDCCGREVVAYREPAAIGPGLVRYWAVGFRGAYLFS